MTANETGGTTVSDLPWPAPWGLPKRAAGLVGAVFFALLTVVAVIIGASLLLSGSVDPRASIIVTLIPLTVGLALAATVRVRVRSRSTKAARSRDGALSVPFLRSLWHGRSWLSKPSKAVRTQAAEATVIIRGGALSVNTALVFHTLRYYHQNPARAELGTDTAVRRVRAADLLT